MCSPEKEILQRYLSHIKVNKSAEQPGRGIYLSRICDLTLTEFILARKLYFKMQVHSRWEECTQSLPLIKLANEISGHGLCQVSSLFKNLFSSNRYHSEKAVRKLMQLPVAVFELEIQGKGSQRLFVTELNPGVDYLKFSKVVQQFLVLRNMQARKAEVNINMPRESLSLLCNLASSDADRLLIKFTACKSMGLSAKAARALYGFENFHSQEEKIMDAIETTHTLRKTIAELAKAESTASLKALGISVPDEPGSESDNMEESEISVLENHYVEELSEYEDSADEITTENSRNKSCEAPLESSNEQAVHIVPHHVNSAPTDPDAINKNEEANQSIQFAPSLDHMLLILRENKLNWFAFVAELRNVIRGYTPEALNQLLADFAFYLSCSDVTVEEEKVIEESRQAYLETERIRYTAEESEDIGSDEESDIINPDDWLSITGLDSEAAKEMIVKQRKIHKRKIQARASKAATEARLLQRKLPNRVSNILLKYPNIGDDIEKFVKDRRVGADAWRRTGVLTFTYGKTSQTPGQKVTYGQIKEHLKEKYGVKLGYGTIVQLDLCD